MATEGQTAMVARGDYPAMVAAIQAWGSYLEEGGTVAKWTAEGLARQAEIDSLNKSL